VTRRATLDTNSYADVDNVTNSAASMQRLRRFSLYVLLLVVASFCFLDYWAYSVQFYKDPSALNSLIAGTGLAPQQYRVGILVAAKFLIRAAHGHIGYRHCFALFDFLTAIATGWLVREILFRSPSFQRAGEASRWFRTFALLGLLAYYLNWSMWYQRPETIACGLFVVASFYLVTFVASPALAIPALLLLAVLQGFIRSDVAILLHFALFVYVLFRGARGFSLSRNVLLAISGLSCIAATAILWALMHLIYPHATYGTTAVFQLLFNLKPMELLPFFLFFAPTIYVFLHARRVSAAQDGPGLSLLLASAIYFASWAIVGRIEEVRIFVPFALALMPQTVNSIAEANLPDHV
jgi:hypothetical protein